MIRLLSLSLAQASRLEPLLPLLARLVFAAVLAGYFWSSGLTKFDGPFSLSVGAYAQIFPQAIEAVGYDASQLPRWMSGVAYAGSVAEMALPALILLGLATRLAALGMIGFVLVQSLTDIWGHGASAATIGALFDRSSDALILDQRALWLFLLAVLVAKGAGALSLDRLIAQRL
ncbi:MAG: DoxX family protein [Paracoccaceae bacterium]